MSDLWFSLTGFLLLVHLQYEVISNSVCSIRLPERSHLFIHMHTQRQREKGRVSSIQCSITSPYFTGKSAECAITLLQFGSSHYWDRLVWAVKTPASPIPIIDCTSSVFASHKPSPPEHPSEVCGGSQLDVDF